MRLLDTCVRFRAHVFANMCNGVTEYDIHVCMHARATEDMCAHVQLHVHMRVLPSTCACKHVQLHTLPSPPRHHIEGTILVTCVRGSWDLKDSPLELVPISLLGGLKWAAGSP